MKIRLVAKTVIILLSCFLGIVAPKTLLSQFFTGYHSSNYSGIYAVAVNPADILSHRFRGDINLAGAQGHVSNNLVSFSYKNRNNDKGGTYFKEPITHHGRVQAQTDIFGPSILVKTTPKFAFAVTTRNRSRANVFNADKQLLSLLLPDTLSRSLIKTPLRFNNMAVNASAWNEYAFTASYQIGISDFGIWKAGASLKWLVGALAGSVRSQGLQFVFDTVYNSQIGLYEGLIQDGSGTITLNKTNNFESGWQESFNQLKPSTIGLDIGMSYEFRDEMQVYENRINPKTKNYLWKVGVSITDIGKLSFNQTQASQSTAVFSKSNYVLNDIKPPTYTQTRDEYVDYFTQYFNASTSKKPLSVPLPTTLHMYYDRYINLWLGVHTMLSIPLRFTGVEKYKGSSNALVATTTIRAELPVAGLYLPVSYHSIAGVNVGLAARVGPLVAGSSALFNTFFGKTKMADAYVMLRIPIFGYQSEESGLKLPDILPFTKKQKKQSKCPN